jgi:hypothetical protein
MMHRSMNINFTILFIILSLSFSVLLQNLISGVTHQVILALICVSVSAPCSNF